MKTNEIAIEFRVVRVAESKSVIHHAGKVQIEPLRVWMKGYYKKYNARMAEIDIDCWVLQIAELIVTFTKPVNFKFSPFSIGWGC